MKTYSPKPRDIQRRWYVIDASGAILGRLASEAAAILRGKHKPIFAPHMDTGDHVIVVNAKDVRLSGGKQDKKVAYRHSGFPGGLTETSYARLLERKPHWAVEKAIKGMLPKNRLGRAMGKKLQVYPGAEHPHQAQKPEPLKLGEVPGWEGLPQPEAAPAAKPQATTARAGTRSSSKRAAAAPAAPKPAAAKRAAAKTTAKETTPKTTTAKKATATSRAGSASKATTATAATSKSPAKKSTARRSLRRKKKEE